MKNYYTAGSSISTQFVCVEVSCFMYSSYLLVRYRKDAVWLKLTHLAPLSQRYRTNI